ncbi:MAG: hypothetical protein DYG90_05545, partial [Chloroflexi bacterium CFX6]|nr:hypothetical protein [Chloroflexi bacterium CFX6]
MTGPAAPASTPSERRRWGSAAATVFGVAVVAVVAHRVAADWRALPLHALRAFHFDARLLAAAWLVQTAGWLLVVDTWRGMLRPAGSALPLARHGRAYALSSLAQVLPGSVWAPLSRVALYRQEGVPGLAVSMALVVELVVLGLAGLALYGAWAPLAHGLPPAWSPLLVPLAGLALVLLHPAALGRLVGRMARWLGQDMPTPRLAGRDVAAWLAREAVVLSLSGVALYLVMRAVGPVAGLADAMSVAGLTVALACLLAWLPATALLKDGGMVVLLTPLYRTALGDTGEAAVVAFGVTVIWRLWLLAVQLTWAGLAAAWVRAAGAG